MSPTCRSGAERRQRSSMSSRAISRSSRSASNRRRQLRHHPISLDPRDSSFGAWRSASPQRGQNCSSIFMQGLGWAAHVVPCVMAGRIALRSPSRARAVQLVAGRPGCRDGSFGDRDGFDLSPPLGWSGSRVGRVGPGAKTTLGDVDGPCRCRRRCSQEPGTDGRDVHVT